MKSLLILQDEISDYNVPFFNKLSEKYELTVAYYQKDKSKSACAFDKVKLESVRFLSLYHIKGLRKLCRRFDVVCFGANMHVLSYCALPFLPHKYGLVTWGIGFRCSYEHPFKPLRKHTFMDWISLQILGRCDANIFYMAEAKKFWDGKGLDMRKVFVAPNTTQVEKITFEPVRKKKLLFVGTLYEGKGLDKLLSSVKELVDKGYHDINLIIVGDGPCRNQLENYVEENNLKKEVQFVGAVYDEGKLADYFAQSLVCISPTQAGLSTPKSMGYGVPFVTKQDAITGGELYHITPGVNGVLYKEDNELIQILEDTINNPFKYIEMGKAAMDYYYNFATIDHMAQGAIEAVEYVCKFTVKAVL